MEKGGAIIDIKNLDVTDSEGNYLLNGLSLKMNKGEILGLVGESGCGKTLTIRTMLDLLPKGLSLKCDSFNMLGEDFLQIKKASRKAMIGANIGLVPQNTVFYLHPMYKIKNQILDGYMLYKKCGKKKALERAVMLFELVGFSDTQRVLNSYPWQLSGGMRQRVNIAMALMLRPSLLIADEPTTALDADISSLVMELFKRANKEIGSSVIVVSHDLSVIRRYCDRIAVMYSGQLCECAEQEELFLNPIHPYTKALISVIPSLKSDRDKPLNEIPGSVPRRGKRNLECIFKPRCVFKGDCCEGEPREVILPNGHYYRCSKF